MLHSEDEITTDKAEPVINNKTATKRDQKDKANKKKDHPILSVLIAVVIAILFRSFAYEPFNIPSGSMKPSLLIGDYIFVEKFGYGYSKYSLPFGLSLFEGRIFSHAPERGDVVVFKLPSNPSINYVKRLIGLPGDRIQVLDGRLFINGMVVTKEPVEPFKDIDDSGESVFIPRFKETLPNGRSYYVLDQRPDGLLDNTPIYTVPEGHYFMMGDNRDNSQDSRVLSLVGYVPEDHLVGPARVVLFSSQGALWNIAQYRSNRYFKSITTHE